MHQQAMVGRQVAKRRGDLAHLYLNGRGGGLGCGGGGFVWGNVEVTDIRVVPHLGQGVRDFAKDLSDLNDHRKETVTQTAFDTQECYTLG